MIRPLAVLLLAACALPALAQGFSALKGHDSNAPIVPSGRAMSTRFKVI